MSNIKNYIDSQELSNQDNLLIGNFLEKSAANALQNNQESQEESFINFKSLNSFLSGVTPQKQEDVLNSLLFAQRVAQKAFPNENQHIEWYQKYFEVLNRIGWVFENKGFTNYEVKGNQFEMNQAILDVLGVAIASATGFTAAAVIAILKKSIDAIKSLADSDSRITAFEKNVQSVSKGNFQIGIASEENGILSIVSSAFILETNDELKRILFFKSNKNATILKFNFIKATISESVFKNARIPIKEKLVADIDNYIADLPI